MQKETVKDIDTLFRRLRDHSAVAFEGAHTIHTPKELTEEILMYIPHLDDGKTFLVLFNVEFVYTLLYTYGVNSNNITFYSDHELKSDIVSFIGCNVITSLGTEMKFDVVVGNPPYQNSAHKAKKNSLWKEFLERATKLADTVALVIPASFASPSPTFNTFKQKIHTINFDVKKHFPNIGSSFCYILWERNHVGGCNVITKAETISMSLDDFDCLPETISNSLLTQCAKVFKNNRTWKRTCEYHTQNIDWIDENGSITVMHGATTKKTNIQHDNNKKIRVYCPTTTYPTFRIAHNVGLSQNQVWTECATIDEANKLVSFLNSNEVQEVLTQFKWSNMYYPQTIARLGV